MILLDSIWILVLLRHMKAAVLQNQMENYTSAESIKPVEAEITVRAIKSSWNVTSTVRLRGTVFGEEAYEDEIYGYKYEWFYRIRDYIKKNWKDIRGNLFLLIFFILFRIFCYR